jgi:hypothetical protein
LHSGVHVTRRAVSPYALALAADASGAGGVLFWSNHATGTIEGARLDAAEGGAARDLRVLAQGVSKVTGMALATAAAAAAAAADAAAATPPLPLPVSTLPPAGGVPLYTSADRGVVARRAVTAADGSALGSEEVLASRLERPMGVALDTGATGDLYFAHSGGAISRLSAPLSAASAASTPPPPPPRLVLRRGTLARIDALALAPRLTADPGERRLLWAESGGGSALWAAGVHGGGAMPLAGWRGGEGALLWPRGLAVCASDGDASTAASGDAPRLLFTEWLGALRVLPLPLPLLPNTASAASAAAAAIGGAAVDLVRETGYAAAEGVRARVAAARALGRDDALFLELVL